MSGEHAGHSNTITVLAICKKMHVQKSLKSAAMLALVTAVLGLWYMELGAILKQNVRPAGNSGTHIKISVESNFNTIDDLFAKTHREAHTVLGSKRDQNLSSSVESILQRRRQHVQAVCSLLEKKRFSGTSAERQLDYYEKSNIIYCSVAKVASKFWARMLYTMDRDDQLSPFEFAKAKHVLLSQKTKNMETGARKKYIQKTINDSFSFIFARNPYKRIFSSYLDKFLSPNPPFWFHAKNMIKVVRNKTNRCGYDLKFSELVKFLISEEPEKFEIHFIPVSFACDVCNVKYDVIGKVETFKDDAYYILNKTQNFKNMLIKDFGQENSIHYIIFNAKRTYGFLNSLLKCNFTHEVVYQRLWRQLQMSGRIEKYHSYPLSAEESKHVNLTSLINLLLDAYHRSSSGARSNSREAYLQAYSEVPLEDLEQLRLKYLKDFVLFDYEDRPSDLFVKRNSKVSNDKTFNYFDILNRTS